MRRDPSSLFTSVTALIQIFFDIFGGSRLSIIFELQRELVLTKDHLITQLRRVSRWFSVLSIPTCCRVEEVDLRTMFEGAHLDYDFLTATPYLVVSSARTPHPLVTFIMLSWTECC